MKKLLIIEEDTDARQMMVFMFENNGYEVTPAGNEISIEQIIQIKPNVIVVDHMLGDIPGNKICLELKANELTKNIPVIQYSANQNIGEITKGSCADAFFAKPYELEDLVYLVARVALGH